MSPCEDSTPGQNGNQTESYPDPTHPTNKPQYDDTENDGWSTIPLTSASSPGATPPFIASQYVHDSKPIVKVTNLCRRRYLLCFIWLSAVLIYIAIELFDLVNSADIMKLLAWKHRDDYVLSLHFKFSHMFLNFYKVAQSKASSSTAPDNGYWGNSDMGWVLVFSIVPCAVICGAGRLFDHFLKKYVSIEQGCE
ncbi:hypothetical protein Forpe1208_v010978 [Fusarium oxysporum f. sp. rapae]|uniref:Uncharacterized protein n=1 Tax=Fusarium oxysporum f. sp. rapae TaxID=485398 RepID=A0A8J5TST9_FUSOX|nr:hypothetical protein Forpe1208_v010978 [Fusarium oxysporum f. sp. rapae]